MNASRRRLLWAAVPTLPVAAFFLLPLGYIVAYAFGLESARSLGPVVADLAASAYHRNRVLFTFQQAALSTLAILLLGLPLAYLFATYDFPAKRLLRAALSAPFVLPALVVALALQAFLGAGGFFGADLLGALGPLGAILLAHVFYDLALVLRLVGGFWEHVPGELRETARTLGAPPRRYFWSVLLPLGAPAILSSAALVFLFTLTSFGVILLLAGPRAGTLETLIYEEVASFRPHYEVAAVLGLLQLLFTLIALLLYLYFQRRAETQFRLRPSPARPRLPIAAWTFLLPVALILTGPSVALVASALSHAGRFSLEGFRLLWNNQHPLGSYTVLDALTNSLQFGLLTVLLAIPFALATSYAFRIRGRLGQVWEAALHLPLGTSSVLLGLGFLLVFDGTPLWDLRAHPFRIVLAHALIAFPLAARILGPHVNAIDEPLREAARTLGARPWQVLARVELPLLRPALAAAASFAFATSLGEFGATLMLRRPEFTTLPLALYDAYGRPGDAFRAQAEALAALLLAVALLAFWLLERAERTATGARA